MDKFAAIERYETKVNELEAKKKLVISILKDKDVSRHSKGVFEDIANINAEIAIYIDVIETISSLEV
ncbi:hypothetical protein [Paenibacillus sp. USHLN196]|uniref:hypothetical protein n=1 Tax=Paenibacillus sp. USHLN196 TaxID=3081291 RepID=UPI0030183925